MASVVVVSLSWNTVKCTSFKFFASFEYLLLVMAAVSLFCFKCNKEFAAARNPQPVACCDCNRLVHRSCLPTRITPAEYSCLNVAGLNVTGLNVHDPFYRPSSGHGISLCLTLMLLTDCCWSDVWHGISFWIVKLILCVTHGEFSCPLHDITAMYWCAA